MASLNYVLWIVGTQYPEVLELFNIQVIPYTDSSYLHG